MTDIEIVIYTGIGAVIGCVATKWLGNLVNRNANVHQEDEHATQHLPSSPGLPHQRRSTTNHDGRIVRPDSRITS